MQRTSHKLNAVWATVGTVSQVAAQAVAIIVLARLLGPHEFGIASVATLIMQFLMIFLEFGIGPYLVHRRELEDELVGTAYRTSILLGFLLAAFIWLSAPAIAALINIPELSIVLKPYAAIFIAIGAVAVNDALLQRQLDFKYLAFADAISYSIGFTFVSIVCALAGLSYWSLVIGHIAQCIIRALIVRRRFPQVSRSNYSPVHIKPMIHFAFGQMLSRIASFIGAQADSFIVAQKLGVTSIGLYGRANQLATMPAIQLGQIFDKVLFPMVARTQDDRPRSSRTYLSAISGITLLSIPVAVSLWIFGAEIVHILLGQKWDGTIGPLCVLALAIPFRLIHKVSDPVARAFGETYSRAWRQWLFVLFLVALTLNYYHKGLTAVAWCVVAAAMLDAFLMVYLCKKVTHSKLPALLLAFLPGLCSGIFCGLLLTAIKFAALHLHLSESVSLGIACVLSVSTISLFLYVYRAQAGLK